MLETTISANHNDVIIPFQLEQSGLRGRIVRLGATLDEILSKHQYPAPVGRLLAEAGTLSCIMGSLLKEDGLFSLQAKGDGPVSLLVADYTADGALRAYANFNPDTLTNVPDTFSDLVGKGYLAFTIDRDLDDGRYQGIVEITKPGLCESAQDYFLQSEQIHTLIKFFSVPHGPSFRTAAICLQAMPPENMTNARDLDDLPPGWDEAQALLETLTTAEALDPTLHPHDVLYRLFHEGGVRVYEPIHVQHRCRCSLERAQRAIATLTDEEAAELAENHMLEVRCEFCNTSYHFTMDDLASLRRA